MVSKPLSGDNANLVAFTDGVDPWPTIDTPNGLVAGSISGVAKGTGVGEWRELALPTATTAAIESAVAAALGDYATDEDVEILIAAAVAGVNAEIAATNEAVDELSSSLAALAGSAVTTSAMNTAIASAIAAIPPDDDSGRVAVTTGGTDHSGLGFGTARKPSATRPTRVDAYGTMTMVSTLLGPQSALVELMSDSNASPTAIRCSAPGALSGVAATVTMPWHVGYDVPANNYYLLAKTESANATVAITKITETQG